MKKLALTVLALLIAVSLAACRSGMADETTAPTGNTTTKPATQPSTTMPTILPDPTIGTNIPDPSVNENSTMPGNGTDATGGMVGRMMPDRK